MRTFSIDRGALSAVVFLAVLVSAGSTSIDAADIDLASTITASDPAPLGLDTVTFNVDYSNNSSVWPVDAYVNLDLSGGFGFDWDNADVAAILSTFTDTNGNEIELLIKSSCEQMFFQLSGPHGDNTIIPATSTSTFTVDIPMPPFPIQSPVLRIDSPPGVAGDLVYTYGSCDDCNDLGTCFGPRILYTPLITTQMEVVDDATGDTTDGCETVINDLTGKIALIRRGNCDFADKAFNAEAAGASAVVFMNNQVQDITSFFISGGAPGLAVTIPLALIDQADGDTLEAAVGSGIVMASMGADVTPVMTFGSQAFHLVGGVDTDSVPENDRDWVTLELNGGMVFRNGFETGDLSGWSSVAP